MLNSSTESPNYNEVTYAQPEQTAVQPQQLEKKSNGLTYGANGYPLDSESTCLNIKHCCISTPMRVLVKIYSFVVATVLIAFNGVISPYLTVATKSTIFPYILFSIYSLIFGITLILAELNFKIVTDHFLYLRTKVHTAILIVFSGTMSVLCFHSIEPYKWVGYVIGILFVCFGIVYLFIGMWTKDTEQKDNNTEVQKESSNPTQLQTANALAQPVTEKSASNTVEITSSNNLSGYKNPASFDETLPLESQSNI